MLVEVEDLSVSFSSKDGTIKAVDGASFKVERGSAFGLAGESGCGKTMTGLSLLKMVKPPGRITGKVSFENRDVMALEGEELRNFRWKEVSMIFQAAMNSLNPVKTVGFQIVDAILDHTDTTKEEAFAIAESVMNKVRLPKGMLGRFPHQLSGGQKQRAVIAMSIALNPKLIIADEPTTALDVVSQERILELLRDIVQTTGSTVLYISHDLSVLAKTCDHIAIMYLGKIVEVGRADDILFSPAHPYTKALIESNITIDKRGKTVQAIAGYPPVPINLPRNCRFNPRCPFATDECLNSEPPSIQLKDDRLVYCYHPRVTDVT